MSSSYLQYSDYEVFTSATCYSLYFLKVEIDVNLIKEHPMKNLQITTNEIQTCIINSNGEFKFNNKSRFVILIFSRIILNS